MTDPEITIQDLTDHSRAWKAAVSYAVANTQKRWREDGNGGEPNIEFIAEWVAYYLAQQWMYRMPAGNFLYSAMVGL